MPIPAKARAARAARSTATEAWGAWGCRGGSRSNSPSLPLVSGSQETWKTPDRLAPGSFHVALTSAAPTTARGSPGRRMHLRLRKPASVDAPARFTA